MPDAAPEEDKLKAVAREWRTLKLRLSQALPGWERDLMYLYASVTPSVRELDRLLGATDKDC